MTVLFVINFAVMHVPPEHYRRVTQHAVQSGSLGRVVHLPFARTKDLHPAGGNDCLILGALVVPRGSPIEAAISPRIAGWGDSPDLTDAPGYPPAGLCLMLAATMRTLARHAAPEAFLPPVHYHRYIHGDVTAAALLLGILEFGPATTAMLTACYGLLGLIALLAFRRLRSALSAERTRAAAFLIIAATLSTCYALPVFGRSFSFAPSDIAIIGFILVAFVRPLGRIPEQRFIIISAAFGSVIAIFEFMTGGIPVGLAMLIALTALGAPPDQSTLWRRVLLGGIAFGAAIVACFAIKLIAVSAVWGTNEVAVFMQQLGLRVDGSVIAALPASARDALRAYHIEPQWIDANALTRRIFAAAMLAYSSFVLGWGSHVLGAIMVLLPTPLLVALAAWALRHRDKSTCADRCLALACAGLVPVLWYLVFANHAALHSIYMVRPLAVNAAIALIMFLPGLRSEWSVRRSVAAAADARRSAIAK
jgi:hypothetical protein